MAETLNVIYTVCAIVAMIAVVVAMATISIRNVEDIKRIREDGKRDAELFEYQKKALDRIVAREEVIRTIGYGEKQQDEEEQQ